MFRIVRGGGVSLDGWGGGMVMGGADAVDAVTSVPPPGI